MKNLDGRKLDHKTLAAIRIRAVKAVQAGEHPEDVIRTLGFSRSCIYTWLAKYRSEGWKGLEAKHSPGRPMKLSGPQIDWIYSAIVGGDPRQFRFEFALWTREIIQSLIYKKFKIKLGLSSITRLLKQLGLSCQRPIFKAWQQNEQQVKNWLKKVFPKIKKRAKSEGAEIYFADEAGVRSDYHSGTTWSPKGETPVVEKTGARFSVNMISALSPRGDLRFMVVEGTVKSDVFIQFLKRLLAGNQKSKVFVVVDGHPTHRSKAVKEFIAFSGGEIELFYLPPYSPELNPDELVWNNLKNGIVGKASVKDRSELKAKVIGGLRKIQKNREKVQSFFQHEKTKYAA